MLLDCQISQIFFDKFWELYAASWLVKVISSESLHKLDKT